MNTDLVLRHAGELQLIRELSDMEFTSIRAPYDLDDLGPQDKSEPARWHPLDGEEA